MAQENFKINTITLAQLFTLCWNLRWWIIAATLVSLLTGFLLVKYSPYQYRQESWILLNHNEETVSELNVLSELIGTTQTKSIENEVFILKSPSMMRKVVEELGIDTRYFYYKSPIFGFTGVKLIDRKRFEYYRNNPFSLNAEMNKLMPEDMLPKSIHLKFRHNDGTSFTIEEISVEGGTNPLHGNKVEYGQQLDFGNVVISVDLAYPTQMRKGVLYECSYTTSAIAATAFSVGLDVETQSGKQSDVIILRHTDGITARSRDILNTLVTTVNKEARAYATLAQQNTIEFIDSRINDLSQILSITEGDLEQYQSSNQVIDLFSQSQVAISSNRDYQAQLNEVQLQLEVIKMIREHLDGQDETKYEVIPSNVGITDNSLNQVIISYNNQVVERNRLISNSSENNPRVLNMNIQLEQLKKSIQIAVDNLNRIYSIREKELQKTISSGKRQISDIPQQQLQVQQFNRKMNVVEPLYLMLQQKREEAQIVIYSKMDKFFVIEEAFGSENPVSPAKMQIMVVALILGLCIVPAIALLKALLRTKVELKSDITSRLEAPVMAVLLKSDKKNCTLIPQESNNSCAESFRMLRTNLQYLPDAKVLQVTSSIPGEGKSFVSANLALSLSTMGKKVLLIGLDLHNPSLGKIFHPDRIDVSRTFIKYIIDGNISLDSIIINSDVNENLDVIFCGPTPPNPQEILVRCDFQAIFDKFRSEYDYIIVDSAPYFVVADAMIINKYVDATIYVVRAGYTPLQILEEMAESDNKAIKNINIVLNDYDTKSDRYGYTYKYTGHYYGYGKKD